MTEQDVFDMAREVCGKWPRFMSNPNLQAFAKLVAAKERIECAQLCDDIDLPFIASAIRERGEA